MSVCSPFTGSFTQGSRNAASPDGALRASATTALAGAGYTNAIVGGTFTVPARTSRIDVSVPIRGLNFFVSAGVVFGYMSAEAVLSLLLFRGGDARPVARQRISLFRAIAPAFWYRSQNSTLNITPSLGVPFPVFPTLFGTTIDLRPRTDEQWSVGVMLETWAGGFGGGAAQALAFCTVPCINVTTI